MFALGIIFFCLLFWTAAGGILLLGFLFGRVPFPVHRVRFWLGLVFAPVIICFFLSLLAGLEGPVRLSPEKVTGLYEIDRGMFPGPQADWQHATYSLEISEEFLTVRDARTTTSWTYPIAMFSTGRWGFGSPEPRHHLIANGPTLYRGSFSHYYVFKSPLYGNVFFRKKPSAFKTATALVSWSLVAIAGVWLVRRWLRTPAAGVRNT